MEKKQIIYVTRDIERALGIEPKSHNWGDYFVISNDGKFAREIKKKHPDNVWLIKKSEVLDTYDLLALPEVEEIISKLKAEKNVSILVFQNTPRIERLVKEKDWNLLNPSAELAKEVEEKISQVVWLGTDAKLLPPHKIALAKNVKWDGKKFVLQFNHSYTGQGTYVIDTEAKLSELQEKFPDRECRLTDFIDGPVFTVNALTADTNNSVLVGNPSYQITGLAPFTDLPFSTIGNDWSLPKKEKYRKVFDETTNIAKIIGTRLAKSGWKGLFGIDVVYDEKTSKTYLLEINARQPASSVFESSLQKKTDPSGVSIFEAHILAFLGKPVPEKITGLWGGSQIVKRVTKKVSEININSLRNKFNVIEYENTIHNKELLRIQSNEGIMESHNVLNKLGKFIESCIK